MRGLTGWLMAWGALVLTTSLSADDWALQMRFQTQAASSGKWERLTRTETWPAGETAVIVCDVWDFHHCLNAVRRLEEFAPRLDKVLAAARKQGATIIHSPSDCMEAYANHPARQRATSTPRAEKLPRDIEHWCSRIPTEEKAAYPIDQSDGGEDDDPAEHAEWAAKLKGLGRNPNMPWKQQSPLITIDGQRDYISDRGDEVWSILEARKIKLVILTGVHTNMCVLGRPFGLRQMVRGGKQVALMRDMTDCMYNPARWPYVNHFTGNDLIISHVERHVCPTITSDQLLGGEAFVSRTDTRSERDVSALPAEALARAEANKNRWSFIDVPATDAAANDLKNAQGPAWYRCTVLLPKKWIAAEGVTFSMPKSAAGTQVWLNGKALVAEKGEFRIPPELIVPDDANLLVLRVEQPQAAAGLGETPLVTSGQKQLTLRGRWQFRIGDEPGWSNIPLPARFGAGSDILFEPRD